MIYLHIPTYVHMCTYMCMWVHTHAHTCYIYVHITYCTSMCTHTSTHTHLHTRTHISSEHELFKGKSTMTFTLKFFSVCLKNKDVLLRTPQVFMTPKKASNKARMSSNGSVSPCVLQRPYVAVFQKPAFRQSPCTALIWPSGLLNAFSS